MGINSVSFPISFVVVCAWSMTRNLRGRLASVGLAQARPNETRVSAREYENHLRLAK